MTRDLIDHILKRIALILLVFWAGWATWQYAILLNANQQSNTMVIQQQAAYQQLQQQAQVAVNQLQAENQQLKQRPGPSRR